MCGIVGYIGKRQAQPILLKGLSQLEYRGYDSAGLAVWQNGQVQLFKREGRVDALARDLEERGSMLGRLGMGHTRWATHGKPSKENAHPHQSANGQVVLVHNGIMENHAEKREFLKKQGYAFASETDSETLANLLAYLFQSHNEDPIATLVSLFREAKGAYALVIHFQSIPDALFAVRKESPLLIGQGEGEMLLASDSAPLLPHTKQIYYMENGEFAQVTQREAIFYTAEGKRVIKRAEWRNEEVVETEKGKFAHYMHKEIHEQPTAVANTLRVLKRDGLGIPSSLLINLKQLTIIACGSAYHVGVALQYVIESLCKIPVRVEFASEFRYRNAPCEGLVIVISQSGETADSLAGLRKAKKLGCPTLAIVNVVGSAIAREADYTLYTQAGTEIAVATTKAYLTQLVVGYYFAVQLAKEKKCIDEYEARAYVADLQELPRKIKEILEREEELFAIAKRRKEMKDCFFIGRGMDYAVSMEGSLKLKEISYVHAEAYTAGELKHGTISLIEEGSLVVCTLTQKNLLEKMVSNMQEVKSRGAILFTVTTEKLEGCAENFVLPKTEPLFMASLAVIPLQLFAYYVSVERGLDVDKPRNLAKSVTVE